MGAAPFHAAVHGPVATVVFGEATKQYAALARMEGFYESEKYANTYLTWDEAHKARICRGYEAFNLPLDVVPRWLAAMYAAEGAGASSNQQDAPSSSLDEAPAGRAGGTNPAAAFSLATASPQPEALPFWHAYCSEEERGLLTFLAAHGVLDGSAAPSYLVSALTKNTHEALAHERLHALYHLSPTYRALLASLWDGIPRAAQQVIQYDLRMRGYREAVWQDELGAYLGITSASNHRADPALEFGNKSAEACREIRQVLLQRIPAAWRDDVGIDEASLHLTSAFLQTAQRELAAPKQGRARKK